MGDDKDVKQDVWVGFDLGGTKMLAVILDENLKTSRTKTPKDPRSRGNRSGASNESKKRSRKRLRMLMSIPQDCGASVSAVREFWISKKGSSTKPPTSVWEKRSDLFLSE